jgi:hypothetical protein
MSLLRRSARLLGHRPARATAPATLGAIAAAALLAACGNDRLVDPRGAGPNAGALSALGGNPQIGTTVSINADSVPCRTSNLRIGYRTGRVMAVSNRAVVVADTSNPANGFTTADYQSFASAFDNLVYPVDTRHFGVPSDFDGNGRVVIFFTTAVNALTPPSATFVIGGFFFNRDLFPLTDTNNAQGCPGSNQGELLYMLAPDPNGTVNGNRRSVASVQQSTVSILGHEFQHLINAGRRLYVLNTNNFDEEVWLNEGLSHVAEELNFYQAAGLSGSEGAGQSPRLELTAAALRQSQARIDALNGFNLQNFLRYSQYLGATERTSPYADNDSLGTRGATWSLLRYAADRTGRPDSAFTYSLVNNTRTGIANLRAAVATVGIPSVETLLRDWAVANYAEGLATGLAPVYDDPSWAYRDVLTRLVRTNGALFNNGVYPLATRALTPGQPQGAPVAAGGAAYFTFSVPAGGTASLQVTAGGGAPPATTRAALVAVTGGRVTPFDGSAAGAIPVTNTGTSAAQYALVVFNANLASLALPTSSSVTYTVTGTGIGGVLASAGVARVQAGPTLARAAALGTADAPVITDAPLLHQLRAGATRELAPLVEGARRSFAARGRRMMTPAPR